MWLFAMDFWFDRRAQLYIWGMEKQTSITPARISYGALDCKWNSENNATQIKKEEKTVF